MAVNDPSVFIEGARGVLERCDRAVCARNHVLGAGFDPLTGRPPAFRRPKAQTAIAETRDL